MYRCGVLGMYRTTKSALFPLLSIKFVAVGCSMIPVCFCALQRVVENKAISPLVIID